jgi:hypothetical protein
MPESRESASGRVGIVEWDVVPEVGPSGAAGWLYGVWVDAESNGMIAEGFRGRRRDAIRRAKEIAGESAGECDG